MNIVIIGSGKVGITLADQLSKEGHQITVLDRKEENMERLSPRRYSYPRDTYPSENRIYTRAHKKSS